MVSIRKLTTPGSVGVECVQDDSKRMHIRRREAKDVKEEKEMEEVKEILNPAVRCGCRGSDPLPPILLPIPLLPVLACIANLAEHRRPSRSGRTGHVRRSAMQRFMGKHGKRESFLGILRDAKFT
jgi:hypothetical protein